MSAHARPVRIGNLTIGGGCPVAVQSMTNTDTKDEDATVAQIAQLKEAGCHIVRAALYDVECAASAGRIQQRIGIPLVGDVHFDWRIAVAGIEAGLAKIRINPGNIGSAAAVRRVADAAKRHGVPLRVGANSGSIRRSAAQKWGADSLVESTLENIRILEEAAFDNIVVSVKSSSVPKCVEAARVMARTVDYPLHLGVTEAGTAHHALVKSAAALGALLLDGIGDTIRVSMSGSPVWEVEAAHDILQACGLEEPLLEVISCPTCARTGFDVEGVAREVEGLEAVCRVPMRVAVMGCVVNGPGEAKQADLGIAGSGEEIVLFQKENLLGRYPRERAYEVLKEVIMEYQARRS